LDTFEAKRMVLLTGRSNLIIIGTHVCWRRFFGRPYWCCQFAHWVDFGHKNTPNQIGVLEYILTGYLPVQFDLI